jgi:hypothetical protein
MMAVQTPLLHWRANGGFVTTTARQLGIHAKTLENWSKGTRHPEAANMGDIKKRLFSQACG